jgi:hypothetical protein
MALRLDHAAETLKGELQHAISQLDAQISQAQNSLHAQRAKRLAAQTEAFSQTLRALQAEAQVGRDRVNARIDAIIADLREGIGREPAFPVSSTKPCRRYSHQPGTSAVNVVRDLGGGNSLGPGLHSDHLGSVTLLVDSAWTRTSARLKWQWHMTAYPFSTGSAGKGALIWMADLDGWAREVARLLRPSGHLFVYQAHPAVILWT